MNSKQSLPSQEVDGTDGVDVATFDDSSPISIDETFEILKNNRRRTVLSYLRENDGDATLKELADYVTAKENNVSVSSITSSQRKRVYVGLYQFHLPKMRDMGIIDYDKNRGIVTLTDKGLLICKAHDSPDVNTKSSTYLYLLIAGIGLLGGIFSWLLSLPTLGVALLFIHSMVLGVVALSQLFNT